MELTLDEHFVTEFSALLYTFGFEFMTNVKENDERLCKLLVEVEKLNNTIVNDLLFPQREKLYEKQYRIENRKAQVIFDKKNKKMLRDQQQDKNKAYNWNIGDKRSKKDAISAVCEAVPGAKGAVRRRKPCRRPLTSILGKSNLQFARMAIILTLSTSSLSLLATDCNQPVSYSIVMVATSCFRMAGFDGSAWDEEEEQQPDHQYYNDFPGKEPPLGGLVDMRIREGGGAAQTKISPSQLPNHLGATLPIGQMSSTDYDVSKQSPSVQGGAREKYSQPGSSAAKVTSRSDLFDDPSYVNVQNVDKSRQALAGATANGNASRDIFDMKPFEDALKVPSTTQGASVSHSPAHVVASMEEQLRREIWYHGKMKRKDAEKLLKANGDFLVRESTTTPGQYVLTGLQNGQPKHLLLVDPEGVVRTKDHKFESVSHLISYHMDNQLPIMSAGSEVCLQQPVVEETVAQLNLPTP
ncbi:SHC-transforming protein 1 [Protopterus annectens]|uniref:SHC-transforming protein 1 n=1 Tax=Protopterus annectens TaxID=7888 RepID=UPI001CF9BB0E|nr:SHC-transforming protein 1 [Protopterus annectens]